MAKLFALLSLALALAFISPSHSATIPDENNFITRAWEDFSGDGKYIASWEVDLAKSTIQFSVVAETNGFVGFGISPTGGMLGADIVIGGVTASGASYFKDRHGTGYVVPPEDASQDWTLDSAIENGTHTSLTFSRALDTCDKDQDMAITANTVKLIWSMGRSDDLALGHVRNGVHSANLLDPAMPPVDTSKFDKWVLERSMVMPSAKTSYWCTMHRSPAEITSERHVVGFTTVLNSTLSVAHTHHLNVYLCTAPDGQDPEDVFGHLVGGPGGECYEPNPIIPTDLCRTMLYVWAIGGKPMFFPEDVGYPLFEGGKKEFIMLELHYNNPQGLSDQFFTSAVEIHHTEVKRPKEAAVLIAAHSISFSHIVPGKVDEFVTIAHCGPQCTGRTIDPAGINFVNVMLHSHLLGKKMKLRHFRGNKELPWIAVDDTYDFDYQQNRPLREHVNVKPGDQLTMECTTDSTKRAGITLGGLSTDAEMCQGIIWYYPKGELRFCESAYPEWSIMEKYKIEGIEWDNILEPPIITAPESMANKTFTEVVDALGPWTPAEIAEFQHQVRYTDHYEVSCGRLPMPEEEKRSLRAQKADPIMVGYPETDGDYQPIDTCSNPGTTTTTTTTTVKPPNPNSSSNAAPFGIAIGIFAILSCIFQ
jgi:hypothetical protein